MAYSDAIVVCKLCIFARLVGVCYLLAASSSTSMYPLPPHVEHISPTPLPPHAGHFSVERRLAIFGKRTQNVFDNEIVVHPSIWGKLFHSVEWACDEA